MPDNEFGFVPDDDELGFVPDKELGFAPDNSAPATPNLSKQSAFMSGVTGFNTGVERFAQGVLQPLLENRLGSRVKAASKRVAARREAKYEAANSEHPLAAKLGELAGGLGSTLLLTPVPGLRLAKYGATNLISKLALQGGLAGAAQYVPENGSRLLNTGIGTLTGATFGGLAAGLGSNNPAVRIGSAGLLGGAGAYGLTGGSNSILGYSADIGSAALAGALALRGATANNFVAKNILNNISNKDETMSRKAAGERLGRNLSVAEASGSPVIAMQEGKLGTSSEGNSILEKSQKQNIENENKAIADLYADISPVRKNAAHDVRDIAKNIFEKKSKSIIDKDELKINEFLGKLSPLSEDTSADVRKMSQRIIKDKIAARKSKASPYYELAHQDAISPNKFNGLMKSDKNIENAINHVLTEDIYLNELKGFKPNSIQVLDLAKKRLDAQIASHKGTLISPGDQYKAAILVKSKDKLVEATDKFSPNYAKARKIFSESSPEIAALREGNIGKLASLDDAQLKNATRTIFDHRETNINSLAKIRDEFKKRDPELWKRIIRNEIENRMTAAKEGDPSSLFYNSFLGSDRDFQQLKVALRGEPKMQQQLIRLRNSIPINADRIKDIRKTAIGKLSNYDDTQLKNISKTIFNPSETDPKVFEQVRDHIKTENPDAWNNLVRNEMERRMTMGRNNAITGTNFYNKILKNDHSYQQFRMALKGNSKAQQKLKDMRFAFEHLINPEKTSSAYGKAKSSTASPLNRNTLDRLQTHVDNALGGKFDQAAVRLITSKDWDKQIDQINKMSGVSERAMAMADLMTKISTTIGVNAVNNE